MEKSRAPAKKGALPLIKIFQRMQFYSDKDRDRGKAPEINSDWITKTFYSKL